VTQFTGRVLKRLDSIWRFVGGVQGFSDMNLAGSIQPVEDLSRQSELGSGLGASGGYFQRGFTFGPVSGTTRNSLDPWTSVDDFEPQRVRASVWLLGCWAQHDTTNVELGGISLTMPGSFIAPGLLSDNELLLAYFDSEIAVGIASATVFPMVAHENWSSTLQNGVSSLPMSIPDGSTLNFMGHASGVGTISLSCLMWMGAAGARPPGVA